VAANVMFIDGDKPWSYEVDAQPDETTRLAGYTDAHLGDFLSRPLKIRQYQWTPGGILFQKFNPWTDFFQNGDVLQKINRFRNLRCTLRLKVLVNGNSFYYGRALLSYNPYLVNDGITKNRSYLTQDLVQASQKPHILLDPTTSQGGELGLPFIWHENALDITQANWENFMGECVIHDFDILRHANGGTDPITVSVFCWAENVTLSIPTTSTVQSGAVARTLDKFGFPKPYTEQAGRKKVNNKSTSNEFSNDGVISKPLSQVAEAAALASLIPILDPFAVPTALYAATMAGMAKCFGYSRPQNVGEIPNYCPRFIGNLCNTDQPENLVKLSVDTKNELTVDTRVMGLAGYDELTIAAIAQRPSYYRQFAWPESAVTDSILTSMLVCPNLGQILVAGSVTEYHLTALSYASLPFECWQGSIKFRFNVVCSEYHRGRLRLVYNPTTNPIGPVPFNQTYSTIIDISEDRDFEYTVHWADVRTWARNFAGASIIGTTHSDSAPVTGGLNYDNGTLSVYVVNELATPSTTNADVRIHVWVSGGEDFAVAVPSPNVLNPLSVFESQSGSLYVPQSEELAVTEDDSNDPMSTHEIKSFGTPIKDDNQFLVFQGERVVSFRTLLKRYNYLDSHYPGDVIADTGFGLVSHITSNFPHYRGWDPNGGRSGVTRMNVLQPYNFSNMTLLNYLTPAFVCRRGGLRQKWIPAGDIHSTAIPTLAVARINLEGDSNRTVVKNLATSVGTLLAQRSEDLKAMLGSSRAYLGGLHMIPPRLTGALEFETPYYTYGKRFDPGRHVDTWDATTDCTEVSIELYGNAENRRLRLDRYISVAEDFQLGMYVGPPIFFSYAHPLTTVE
jgi:hypothetical protein